MGTKTTKELKSRFSRGSVPTEEDFGDLLDSYVHKEEGELGIGRIAGLAEQLNGKAGLGTISSLNGRISEIEETLGILNESLGGDAARAGRLYDELEQAAAPEFSAIMASTSGAASTLGADVVVYLPDRQYFARGMTGLPSAGGRWNEAVRGTIIARSRLFRHRSGAYYEFSNGKLEEVEGPSADMRRWVESKLPEKADIAAFGEGAEVSINGLQKAVVSDAAKRESLTDVCRALGVTYNASTGKYTLNGLTDITYDELTEIYARRGQIGPAGYFQYAGFPCRTNLLTQKTSRYVSGIAYCFNGSTDVEVVNLGSTITVKAQDEGMTRAFTGCRRLHTIMGQLSLGSKPAVTETFSECRALREVRIASLGTNISFEDSPMLTYSTLNYLVEHAANTEEITVTVHEGVMALLSGAQSLYDTPHPFTAEEWKRYTKPGTAVEFYWPDLQGYAAGDYVVISGTARDTGESYYGIGRVLEVVTDEDGSNMRPRVAAVCGGTGSPGDLAAWSLLKVTAARHEIYFATTE